MLVLFEGFRKLKGVCKAILRQEDLAVAESVLGPGINGYLSLRERYGQLFIFYVYEIINMNETESHIGF